MQKGKQEQRLLNGGTNQLELRQLLRQLVSAYTMGFGKGT